MINGHIRTLVAVDSDVDEELVRAALPTGDALHVVGLVSGIEESWAALQETSADLLVVACSGYSERALVLIDAASRQQPDRPVVVLSTASHLNGFVRRAFEAGADDIVEIPGGAEQVAFVLEKAIARKRGSIAANGIATGSMLTVLGPKGGTGKTLTSCNLAVSLALTGKRVALVDLDLQFGDVGLSLGLTPDRTMYELAKSGGSLDAEKIDGYLGVHASGVRVLMAPARPDHAGIITPEFLRDVYAVLRSSYDYVIVDTPPGFTPEVIATIDSSTQLVVVGMLDSLSLKNTKLGLETLELMGYDRDRIRVVLNRSDSRVGITSTDVKDIIGRVPDVLVPSDREIPRQLNQGEPIVSA
jgi:pilus assembly protein CpaE